MEGDLQRKLGASLRAVRNEQQASQIAFSEWLGFHRTYVGALERGERNPTLRTVERLATGLGMDALDLLRGPDGEVPVAESVKRPGTAKAKPPAARAKVAKAAARRRTA